MTFWWDASLGTRPWAQLGSLGPAVTVFLAQENARRTLETGVTSGSRSGLVGVHRRRDARPHQPRRDAGAANVRGRLRAARQQRAVLAQPLSIGPRPGGRRRRGAARGPPADRGRRGLDQGLRLDRQRSGRHRLPDLHVRGDEGGGGRGPPGRQADLDPLVRSGWRTRRRARRGRLGRARDRTWTTPRSRRWRAAARSTCRRSITTATTSPTRTNTATTRRWCSASTTTSRATWRRCAAASARASRSRWVPTPCSRASARTPASSSGSSRRA